MYAKHFISMTSFNTHGTPLQELLLFSLFSNEEPEVLEKFKYLPKVTLVSDRAGI